MPVSYKEFKWKNLISSILSPLCAIVFALALGAVLIAAMGLDVGDAYTALVQGSFGSKSAIGETIVKMTPLIFTGLSFALASRCGLINIGAEGQLYIGGLCATIVGLFFPLPGFLHVTVAIIAGFIGGGLWGMLAGFFKVRFGASEMITTIMLNYIANYFVNFMVTDVLLEPPGTMPQTAQVMLSAQLPRILPGTRVSLGIVLALLAVLFYYVFLWTMKSGFETRVVGLNPEGARYAGINCKRKALMAMFLAGGFAGLAGVVEILGIQLRLFQNFSPGYGFDGIAAALLGQNSPLGIVFSSMLFGALRSGSNVMQMNAGVPSALIYIIQALVIVFVVGSRFFAKFREKQEIKRLAKEEQ